MLEMDIEPGYTNYEEDEKYVQYDEKALQKFKDYELSKTSKNIVTQGVVEFKNVSAKYASNDQIILKNLSFTIKSG